MVTNGRVDSAKSTSKKLTRAERKALEWERRLGNIKASEAQALEEQNDVRPVPPGIDKALQAMATLTRELRERQSGPVTVNIEVLEDEWVLLVRGIRPDFHWWDGYKVFWLRMSKPTWAGE